MRLMQSGMTPNSEKNANNSVGDFEEDSGPRSANTPMLAPKNSGRRILIVVGAVLLGVIATSAAGYAVGRSQGRTRRQEVVSQITEEQFLLAVEDLDAGRFEIARQRLEYVSRLDPSYPNIAERLGEALLALNAPTATPVERLTPTPNLAPVGALFDHSLAAFEAEDWDLSLDLLLALRAKDAEFKSLEVDRLMFGALRNRGVNRISVEGRLEEGIYDLSRAQRFGPLDREADNWKSWAQLYLLANSYMGLDWSQAAFYYGQLYLIAPYLKNDTYLKYANSAQAYGDQLYAEKDSCAAQEQYQQSLSAWENPQLIPTATKAADACRTATAPAPLPAPSDETPEGTPSIDESGTPTPIPPEPSASSG